MNESNIGRLRDIVEYAYNHTKFYKQLYDNMGIQIENILSLEQLPIITPDDLREHPFDFKSDDPIFKTVVTSGTTSTPKILFRTKEDFEHSVENECILLRKAGITQRDIVCIVQPFGINGYGELTLEACKKMGIPTIPIGDIDDENVIWAIDTFKPTVLDITPSRLASIISKIKDSHIRIAMIAGEKVNDAYKRYYQKKYQIRLINQYGSTELDGLAGESTYDNGLELISKDFLFEIVDGELVVTSLYHHGSPLIRYKLGDFVSISDNHIHIHGRNSSIQLYDGVILDSASIDEIINRYDCLSWQSVIYHRKKQLCFDLYLIGAEESLCNTVYSFVANSLDFADLVSNETIDFKCLCIDDYIGSSRKKISFIDTRNCSDNTRVDLVKAYCFEAFYYSLPPLTNRKLESLLSKLSVIDITILTDLGIYITRFWNRRARKIGDALLHYCLINNKSYTLKKCLELAGSSNWEIREEAAKVISILIIQEFDLVHEWLEHCISSDNDKIRRAILVAIKYAVEYDADMSHRSILLDYMDNFLFDQSIYVKKSFGSFTIGDGFLNVCPELVEKKLDDWLIKYSDAHVAKTIISIFKSSGGKNTWPLAKKYLRMYSNGSDSNLQKAVHSTMQYLERRVNMED